MEEMKRSCVDCALAGCGRPSGGKHPEFCESAPITQEERAAMVGLYQGDELRIMQAAAETAARTGRDALCRVEEVMDFARRMGFHKIGIATCGALQAQAVTAAKIFRIHGFEVFGASCKFGSVPLGEFHCAEDAGVNPDSMACNPIVQAQRLNEAGTELNVIMGLCVGHDSLFMKHSDVPCTCLVAKDRTLGNNPVAALDCCKMPAYQWARLMREDDSFSPLP